SLERLQEAFPQEEFRVVAIAVSDTPQGIAAFLGERPSPFPILLDTDRRVAGDFKAAGLPVAYRLNREGRLPEATRTDDLLAQVKFETTGRLTGPRRHRRLTGLTFVGQEAFEVAFESHLQSHAGLVSMVQIRRLVSRIGSP
ncbi:MAG: TlpA family protein disulfide reductase, partial [Rhodospirillales bacterium]|nr:TlpA family protein disulfide reductase [Rhodospirillales bacterium]